VEEEEEEEEEEYTRLEFGINTTPYLERVTGYFVGCTTLLVPIPMLRK
jgi:hypothetical protein